MYRKSGSDFPPDILSFFEKIVFGFKQLKRGIISVCRSLSDATFHFLSFATGFRSIRAQIKAEQTILQHAEILA